MIYFIITALLFVLFVHFDINRKTKNKDLWYNIVLIILICLAGLRYRIGIDTLSYSFNFYHATPLITNISSDLKLTEYPLWKLLNSLFFSFGGRFYMVQFAEAAFVNILIFKYIEKHSPYIFLCVFLYFIWLYPGYSFEEMKQSFAVALSLFANDYILEKKYVKGVLVFISACLFHPGAILVFLFSFLTFLRFNFIGLIFVISGFVLGTLIQEQLELYIGFLDVDTFLQEKMEGYVNSDRFFAISGMNLNFYILHLLPFVYGTVSLVYLKKKQKEFNMEFLRLEPFVVIGLFFVVLGTRIGIVYRYVNYYAIYLILCFVQAFIMQSRTNRNSSLKNVLIAVPFIFFVWSTYMGIRGENDRFNKFYPYASIIEKGTDPQREKVFKNHSYDGRIYPPRDDEY